VIASLRAAFRRRCPSTTSPSLRTKQGILNPNSRIEAHIRSTPASFLRGLRAYSTSLLIDQISILWVGAWGVIQTAVRFRLDYKGESIVCKAL